MSDTYDDLVGVHGYTPDQARAILDIVARDEGRVQKPLNERCFRFAQHYSESSRVLEQSMEQSKDVNLSFGIVLCKSLSLELFFKTLVIIDRDELIDSQQLTRDEINRHYVHAIPRIFDQISFEHRERLVKNYCNRIGVSAMGVEEFRVQLVMKANDIFVEWRYLYERGSGPMKHLDLVLLNNLISSVEQTCVDIKTRT